MIQSADDIQSSVSQRRQRQKFDNFDRIIKHNKRTDILKIALKHGLPMTYNKSKKKFYSLRYLHDKYCRYSLADLKKKIIRQLRSKYHIPAPQTDAKIEEDKMIQIYSMTRDELKRQLGSEYARSTKKRSELSQILLQRLHPSQHPLSQLVNFLGQIDWDNIEDNHLPSIRRQQKKPEISKRQLSDFLAKIDWENLDDRNLAPLVHSDQHKSPSIQRQITSL